MSKLLNEGWHRGKAIDFGISVSESGTESIAILLQVAMGDPSGDEGRVITAYLYCTEAAVLNTVEALRILGWQGENLGDFESSELKNVDELLPNDVTFPINNEEYNGNVNSKVGKICRASSGKIAIKNRIEGAAAKSFGARFKAACAAVPAGAAPVAKAAPKAATQARPAVKHKESLENDANEDFPY
jgi:hypothetical protein